MLSRRTSNMIFYAVMVAILLVVVVARLIIVGSMNRKIDETTVSNRSLQAKIESLELAVQENKGIASDHLYELYDKVPETFDPVLLEYYIDAQLELLGISIDNFDQRYSGLQYNEEVDFSNLSAFDGIDEEFKVVENYVHFEVLPDELTGEVDLTVVDDFIDALYSSEQIFVVSEIEFSDYTSGAIVGVDIYFLAFYKLVEE